MRHCTGQPPAPALRSPGELLRRTRVRVRRKLNLFVDELQYSQPDLYFVPSQSFRQGSPDNPYLSRRDNPGHHWSVEPTKLAQGLIAWRQHLAEQWHRELRVIASTHELDSVSVSSVYSLEDMPDAQLLEGLATRIAILEMLNDLSVLPSQKSTTEWLAIFLRDHQRDLSEGGSVATVLADLRAEPLRVREGSLFDPLMLADEISERKGLIAVDMANEIVSATSYEHHALQSSFLEKCLEK